MSTIITCKATVELTINVIAKDLEDAKVLIATGKGQVVGQKQVSIEEVAKTTIPDGTETPDAIPGNRKRRRLSKKVWNRA